MLSKLFSTECAMRVNFIKLIAKNNNYIKIFSQSILVTKIFLQVTTANGSESWQGKRMHKIQIC
jgi:hypothetical protein